jgi:hypothetical protein
MGGSCWDFCVPCFLSIPLCKVGPKKKKKKKGKKKKGKKKTGEDKRGKKKKKKEN